MNHRFGKWVCALWATTILVLSGSFAPADAVDEYRFGTSKPGGAFYPIAAAVSRLAEKTYGDRVSLQSGGGASNTINIGKGKFEFGLTFSNSVYDAITGQPPYKEKLTNLRIAAVLYPQDLFPTVWADSDIRTVADLKGKRVNVLPRFFSTHHLNRQVLSAVGISFDDFSKTGYLGLVDAVNAMKDGLLDVYMVQGAPDYAPLVQLMAHKPIRFLSFTEEEIRKIRKAQPAVVPVVVDKKHYNQERDVRTVRSYLVIITHAGVSETLGYKMAKLIYENEPTLGTVNVNLRGLSRKDAVLDFGVARHPGLNRYLKERGDL